jgi:uncharacterized protein (DUF2062 family)
VIDDNDRILAWLWASLSMAFGLNLITRSYAEALVLGMAWVLLTRGAWRSLYAVLWPRRRGRRTPQV